MLLTVGTVLVAAVITGIALRLSSPGNPGASQNPISSVISPSPSTSGSQSKPSSPIPSAAPTPFVPTSWVLRAIPLPPGHEDGIVLAVSPDASVVLFRDASVYDQMFIAHDNGELNEILVPNHVAGAPIRARLSPDGTFALVWELGHLWRYDIPSHEIARVPDAPGTDGSGPFVFLSNTSVALLTGPIASGELGGQTNSQLWLLDLSAMSYAKLGSRHDGIALYPITGGVALLADHSRNHDNTGWVLYRIAGDGAETLMFDAGGSFSIAVSRDGSRIAASRGHLGTDGTWAVDLPRQVSRRISSGAAVDFSPDGRLLRVDFSGGPAESLQWDGTIVNTVDSAQTAAWVGLP